MNTPGQIIVSNMTSTPTITSIDSSFYPGSSFTTPDFSVTTTVAMAATTTVTTFSVGATTTSSNLPSSEQQKQLSNMLALFHKHQQQISPTDSISTQQSVYSVC